MGRQPGFFDAYERLRELSAMGDDLERIAALVAFERFRPELEQAVPGVGVPGVRPATKVTAAWPRTPRTPHTGHKPILPEAVASHRCHGVPAALSAVQSLTGPDPALRCVQSGIPRLLRAILQSSALRWPQHRRA